MSALRFEGDGGKSSYMGFLVWVCVRDIAFCQFRWHLQLKLSILVPQQKLCFVGREPMPAALKIAAVGMTPR